MRVLLDEANCYFPISYWLYDYLLTLADCCAKVSKGFKATMQ